MNEMVERVARLLANKHAYQLSPGKRGGATREAWAEAWWSEFEGDARDVIAVMREPTDDMKRCSDEVHWGFSCAVCGGLEAGWHAMIDAALASDPTTPTNQ